MCINITGRNSSIVKSCIYFTRPENRKISFQIDESKKEIKADLAWFTLCIAPYGEWAAPVAKSRKCPGGDDEETVRESACC